uniref:Uncharacterized protein n=1 Tax=Anguilla anguilla TaxID=7936 RepID=A0A0E9QXZ4_ANGAN
MVRGRWVDKAARLPRGRVYLSQEQGAGAELRTGGNR